MKAIIIIVIVRNDDVISKNKVMSKCVHMWSSQSDIVKHQKVLSDDKTVMN